MGELESVKILREALLESLGDKRDIYLQLMNKWFKMELTREQLECEIQKCLSTSQFHLHNQLILKILKKCAQLAINSNESKPKWNRCSSYISNNFEPIDPIFYEVTEKQEVHTDLPPLMSNDRLIPDTNSMLERTNYAAWEHGLQGSCPQVANLLTIATHQFLRNIIVAIVRKRKGCCFRQNGFLHSLGQPSLNPWLNNLKKNQNNRVHSLILDPNVKGLLIPSMRRTEDELNQSALDDLALSDAPSCQELEPISMHDLIYTLKLHPSLVASYFTKTVNTERMYANVFYTDN